ncbi:MAG TPA: BF3164 family lipoprotein [Longimicrobium sp.]|nr:BF3164 family lipoprotein [Longimicrobium sp.]
MIHVRGSLVALLAIAAVCACERRNDEPPPAPDASEVALRGEVLTDSDSLAMPLSVDVVGEHLVVTDGSGARMIRVLNARDGALVASFGRKGGGPGEFQAPTHADAVPGSRTAFWIHDRGLRRTSYFDLARDTVNPLAAGRRSVSYEPGPMPMYVRWTSPSTLIGAGIVTPGRLAVFDTAGKLVRTVGEIPGKDGRTPETVLQHAYTGPLVAKPDRSRLALANRHADRLEIFDAAGKALRTVQVRDGFLPAFVVATTRDGPAMASGEEMRFGYIDAAATEKAIYGLFSGVRRMDRPGRAAFGDIVYVFDWEGRVTGVLKLDGLAIAMAVDPDDRTLYAIRLEPQPAIVRYSLPQSGTRTASAR